jgi:lycopene beta-cyclase
MALFSSKRNYDYIISGAGCAGLSLLVHMIHSGQFRDKKILLIDKEKKNRNDRTWCFWETEPGLFEPIIYKSWENAWFHNEQFSTLLSFRPYTYKLIRGIDFYTHCMDLIGKERNIDVLTGEVQQVISNEKETYIMVDGLPINAAFIFNSILFAKPKLKKKEYYLLQHFKGWVIHTPGDVFKPGEATLMDFRTDQRHGTTFAYVMPFASNRALVEYTLFTGKLLEQKQYEEGLRNYIHQYLFKGPYRIMEEEFGVIPMTNYRFPTRDNNIVNIGTAGGQTKASSGYTFKFIQKNAAGIVDQLIRSGHPFLSPPKKKFHFYDSVLLHILHHNNQLGKTIFSDLFKKNKTSRVLKFLDNESTLKDEMAIISSLPSLPFLQATFRRLQP